MLFALINAAILIAAVTGAVWVWRDASRLDNPWAPTWALATLLFVPLALPAYLLQRRARRTSPQ